MPYPYGPSEETNDPYAVFQVNISALFSQLLQCVHLPLLNLIE